MLLFRVYRSIEREITTSIHIGLAVRLAMLNTALTHPCVRSISTSMLQKNGKEHPYGEIKISEKVL